MKLYLLLAIFFLIQPGKETLGADSLYRLVRHYTDADGLPQNSMKAIACDASGFIWIATEGGLVRFDGQHFETFTGKKYGLHSNRFVRILKLSGSTNLLAVDDQLGVLSLHAGKAVMDSQHVKQLWSLLRHITDTSDKDILPRTNQSIWYQKNKSILLTQSGAFYRVDSASYSFHNRGLVEMNFSYKKPPRSQLFLLQDELFSFDGQTGQFSNLGAAGPQLQNVAGLPWPGFMKDYQLLWNPLQPDYILYCFDSQVYQLRYDHGRLSAERIIDHFDAVRENIVSVWMDRPSSKLLLGTNNQGLFVFTRPLFRTALAESKIANQVYYAQAMGDSGSIISAQGYVFHPPDTFPARSVAYLQKHADIYSLPQDEKGYLWVNYGKRIDRFDPSSLQSLNNWNFPADVSRTGVGLDQSLWVSLTDGSVSFISPSGAVTHAELRLPLSASCIVQQGNGIVWLGTADGLYRYDPAKKEHHLVAASRGKDIRSIYVDESRLWITSYGDGFFLLEKDHWTSFPLDSKQHLINPHCIFEDAKGFLWITTNNGLFQVKKADLLSYAYEPTFRPYYYSYNKDDGFSSNEFNGGCTPCGIRLPDGMLSLPSMNGLVWFYPERTIPVLPDKPVFIDHILVDNNEIPVSSTLQLPRDMKQLRIDIDVPFLGNRDNLYVSYTLTRDQNEPVWLPLENNLITFSTLPAGNYVLDIRKQEGFGRNNYSHLLINLYVPQHWLLQPLSFVVMIILLVVCLLLIDRFRTRFIRRRNMLLEQKVAEQTQDIQRALDKLTSSQHELIRQAEWQQKMLTVLSHDIKAPLKYLMLATDRIRQGIWQDNITAYQQPSKTIHEYSTRLYYSMENLLQYIKTQLSEGVLEKDWTDLHQIAEEKRLIFTDIAAGYGTVIKNNIRPGVLAYTNHTLLAVILHNLIDNAVKVTDNGTVLLDAKTDQQSTVLYVSDTGIGMTDLLQHWINEAGSKEISLTSANHSGSGIGLYIVKGLVMLLGIELSVSGTEEGTTFKLVIPARTSAG